MNIHARHLPTPARFVRHWLGATGLIALLVSALLPGAAAAEPSPLTPAQIVRAYALPRAGAANQTIAIVSAYGDPAVASDLAAYSKRFGLPECTTTTGCLRIVNQVGNASPLPSADTTGAYLPESSTGVEVARGVCASCRVMLVEARSEAKADLSAAVGTAALLGATVTVTTFNAGEETDDPAYSTDYVTPRTVVVAATGDTGYTSLVNFPATLPGVLAVGGTQLTSSRSGAYGGERVWNDSTSGCSVYEAAASYQAAFARGVGCGTSRVLPDVVAEADPGVLVHIADAGLAGGPWFDVRGTSVAAPIVAGIIGLAGSAGRGEVSMLYAHAHADAGAFHNITAGAETGCPAANTLCAAGNGPDGASGLGSPDGLAAFLPSGGAVSASRPALTTPRGLRLDGSWTGKLALQNGNPFAVGGSIALQRRVRSGGRTRAIVLASARITLASLGGSTATLTVPAAKRQWLTKHATTSVTARVSIAGPAGRSVTLMRPLSLTAP